MSALTDLSLATAAKYNVCPWRLDDWENVVPPEVVEIFRRMTNEVEIANAALAALGKCYEVHDHLVERKLP
jgi:hypothetical protein